MVDEIIQPIVADTSVYTRLVPTTLVIGKITYKDRLDIDPIDYETYRRTTVDTYRVPLNQIFSKKMRDAISVLKVARSEILAFVETKPILRLLLIRYIYPSTLSWDREGLWYWTPFPITNNLVDSVDYAESLLHILTWLLTEGHVVGLRTITFRIPTGDMSSPCIAIGGKLVPNFGTLVRIEPPETRLVFTDPETGQYILVDTLWPHSMPQSIQETSIATRLKDEKKLKGKMA